jgi:hypothetical protein
MICYVNTDCIIKTVTQEFYKASKKRFDDDASFKERAQQAVVKLQVTINTQISC